MMQIKLDTLVIQTLAFCPCLETAGEIALVHAEKGRRAGFAFIETDDPDCAPPYGVWPIHATVRRKVARLQELLGERGVAVLEVPEMDSGQAIAIRRFSAAPVESVAGLMALEYRGAPLGMGVASSIITETRDTDPAIREYASLSSRLGSAAFVYEVTRELIRKHEPELVVLYNGRFGTCRPILEAARHEAVRFQFFESGSGPESYSLLDEVPHDLSYIRTRIRRAWSSAGSDREAIGAGFFARKRRGDAISGFCFTAAQHKGWNVDRTRAMRVTYFTSSDDEWLAIGDGVRQPLFPSQRDAVRFLMQWVDSRPQVELVIRVHPNMMHAAKREKEWWHQLSGSNVTLLPASSPVDSYALAESSDKVISYGSTMGIESTYWGHPSILIGDAAYAGFQAVHEPRELEALVQLLDAETVVPMAAEHAVPYAYYAATEGIRYKFYEPSSPTEGTLLGQPLSMDIPVIHRLKRTKAGRSIKRLRDSLTGE